MGMVELTRYQDAAHARVAARTLLAGGLHAEVARDGTDQLIRIDEGDLDRACSLLGIDRAMVGSAAEPEYEDQLPEEPQPEEQQPEAEPELVEESAEEAEPVESIFGAGLTTAAVAPAEEHAQLPPPPDAVAPAQVAPEPPREKVRRPDIDADGYAVIALAASDDAASVMAAALLEAGIGVDIVEADEAGYGASVPDPAAPSPSRVVRVLPTDTDRALDLLGLSAVDPPRRQRLVEGTEASTIDGEEVRGYFGGRLRVTRRQLIFMIVAYVLALILIPLLVFWGTQQILDPGIPDPVPTLPGGTTPGVD